MRQQGNRREDKHVDDLGKIAYDAYREAKSLVTGDELPEWEQLSALVKAAWSAAANAVANAI